MMRSHSATCPSVRFFSTPTENVATPSSRATPAQLQMKARYEANQAADGRISPRQCPLAKSTCGLRKTRMPAACTRRTSHRTMGVVTAQSADVP